MGPRRPRSYIAAHDASRVASERMVVPTLTRTLETNSGMQVKTILNRIQKQRGFVYGAVQLEEQIAGLALTVEVGGQEDFVALVGELLELLDDLAAAFEDFVFRLEGFEVHTMDDLRFLKPIDGPNYLQLNILRQAT